MPKIYLSLGSNLEDRLSYLDQAIAALKENMTIEKISSIIETEPVGYLKQNKFLNLVLKAHTYLSPDELLKTTQSIEQCLGRERMIINGPRTIDIDILLYDQLAIDTPSLKIPHPRMYQRSFVTVPLKEIEPGIFNQNISMELSERE